MFEKLTTGPIDKLSQLIYRWRGIDSWPIATATVYSCEFHQPGRNRSYYKVTFSYRAEEEIQKGSYNEESSESLPPFLPGDTFTIRWNPKRPNRFYAANSDSQRTRSAYVLILAIAFLILLSFLSFR